MDGLIEEADYNVQRKALQDRIDTLVIPEAEVAFDAGEMLESLGTVWQTANLEDKHGLLRSMLEAVYVDLAETRSIVGIIPKAPFYPLFQSLRHDPDAKVKVLDPETMKDGSLSEAVENCGLVETGEAPAPRSHTFGMILGRRGALVVHATA